MAAVGRLAPERNPGLPANLHYYEGKQPQRWVSGTPWEQANFRIVAQTAEIFPGFFQISTQSHKRERRR